MPAKKSAAVVALGEAISVARRERGYGQEGFARRVGLDRSYYGAVERGEFNVTLSTVLKIAGGLGVQASTLLRRAQL
jgi:transcriptional regulator with XRE-family HTH domain